MFRSDSELLPREHRFGMPYLGIHAHYSPLTDAELFLGAFSVWPKGFIVPHQHSAIVFRDLIRENVRLDTFMRNAPTSENIYVESEAAFACGCTSSRVRVVPASVAFEMHRDMMERGAAEPCGPIIDTQLRETCLLHEAMRSLRSSKRRAVKAWFERYRGRNPAEADMSPFYDWPPDDSEDDPDGELAEMWSRA